MADQSWSLASLRTVFSDLAPGDVFHLLNDSIPHVVVIMIDGDGESVAVIDQEGNMIFGHRPVRLSGEHWGRFALDYGFFELVAQVDPLDQLDVGDVVIIYDRESVDEGYQYAQAEVVVLGYKNIEGKYFVTTDGGVIFFDDAGYLPTNYSLPPDKIEFTPAGKERMESLRLSPHL